MKNRKTLRTIAFVMCMTVIMSVSSVVCGVFANETNDVRDNRSTLTPREGDNVLPDTDDTVPGNPDMDDNDIIPAPDTDPDSGVIEGDPDTDDGKPDNDANIGDNDKNDNNDDNNDRDDANDADDTDENDEKKFSYTGLIVALIIAAAVIILLAVMIPMNKKKGQGR